MRYSSWLRHRTASRIPRWRTPRRTAASRFRPRFDAMEGRLVLSQLSLTVSSLADAGPGTLRAAILAADAGKPSDKFTIGFSVTGTIDLLSPLPNLNNTVAIQGPGAGSLTVERAAGYSFPSAVVTVDPGQTAGLSGLTIANGDAGGIANHGGTLTVSGCTISGNSGIQYYSNTYGGGIYNLSDFGTATLTVVDSTFSGNSATFGGGILSGGPLTIVGCAFSGNSAVQGGGILSNGPISLSGSTLSGNSATYAGGGLVCDASQASVSGCTISGNSASFGGGISFMGRGTVADTTLSGNSASFGGGIYNAGILTISNNSTLSGNSASDGGGIFNNYFVTLSGGTLSGNTATLGGGIYNGFGTLTIRGGSLSCNTATEGGGIFNNVSGTLDIRGSTLSGNSAGDNGGGVYNSGTATIQESTLSGNSAGSDGGGLFNAASGTLTLADSVVRHNTARRGADLYNLGSATLRDSTVDQIGP